MGKWDGNTFVVNSIGFDDRTWLDHNGYPHTDQMRLEERIAGWIGIPWS